MSFLNRSIPFSIKNKLHCSQKNKFIKIEAPFIEEISGLAIVKMLDKKAQNTMMLKLKSVQNLATLNVTKSSLETVIFDPKEMLGILDMRLMGYYKIKWGYYNRIEVDTIDLSQLIPYVNNLLNL